MQQLLEGLAELGERISEWWDGLHFNTKDTIARLAAFSWLLSVVCAIAYFGIGVPFLAILKWLLIVVGLAVLVITIVIALAVLFDGA